MTDSAYRIAPCGFTDDEWETFNREGILFFEDALDPAAGENGQPSGPARQPPRAIR